MRDVTVKDPDPGRTSTETRYMTGRPGMCSTDVDEDSWIVIGAACAVT